MDIKGLNNLMWGDLISLKSDETPRLENGSNLCIIEANRNVAIYFKFQFKNLLLTSFCFPILGKLYVYWCALFKCYLLFILSAWTWHTLQKDQYKSQSSCTVAAWAEREQGPRQKGIHGKYKWTFYELQLKMIRSSNEWHSEIRSLTSTFLPTYEHYEYVNEFNHVLNKHKFTGTITSSW